MRDRVGVGRVGRLFIVTLRLSFLGRTVVRFQWLSGIVKCRESREIGYLIFLLQAPCPLSP